VQPSVLARRIAKKVTPALGGLVVTTRMQPSLEVMTTYLSLLAGKGSGSGWDSGETLAAARILSRIERPVVVDCGANLGNWTEGVRAHLGHARGHWLLVEPMTEYAEKLRVLDNVGVEQVAVGESPAIMTLHVPDRPSGWMSLHPRGDSFARNERFLTRDVTVVPLDDLLEVSGMTHVDFLKLDLEGHELFALKGARKYLEQGRISALSFEFGSANVNSRTFFRDMWELLGPLGYELYRIVPGGRTVKIVHYDETLEFFRGATNYIARLISPRPAGADAIITT
jgi:FkbM family methyltransferase